MKLRILFPIFLMLLALQGHAYKEQSININVNGQQRNMICYTPNTMQANMPLWIVTHGMNQNPEYQRDGDHLYELIDTAKFVVCYLRSDGNTWDIGGQKDLNFVRQTITEMGTRFGINKNRVYWSGFSMGSMLIYHGIENGMGDVITAFAPCSGIKFGEPWNNCKKPINLIHCHGTGDDVFPISQYDPRGYAMHFKDIDRCTTYKKTENYRPAGGYDNGTKEVWSGGLNGTEVEILLCNNHGHWPSVNYTRETWNFCRRFSKATPKEEYEGVLKEANTLLEQWQGDVEIFSTLKTKYSALQTAVETYGNSADLADDKALQTATGKIQTAITTFVNVAETSKTNSKTVKKEEFDPNFHIYLCFGQSNMEGNATPELQDFAGSDERFLMMAPVTMSTYRRTKGNWYVARPPLCRNTTGLTPADYFGKTMIKNLPDSISVGVINVSLGGCSIDMFNEDIVAEHIKQQADWLQGYARQYGNNPFRYLVDMAKAAQEVGVIKGILLHQGCTDNGQPDWPGKVNLIYTRLLQELGLNQEEVPLLVGELLQQNQGGVCWGHNSVIAKIPSVINNAYVVSSEGCPGASDGLHFTAEGYRKIGANYATTMLKVQERFSQNNNFSIQDLKAKETDINMSASSYHPLYIILTDKDGEEHDVTSSCEFTSSDPSVLDFSSLSVISGNKDGDVTVTATFTNAEGEQVSVDFNVSVRIFPLTEDIFNPNLIGSDGTYKYYSTAKTGRFTLKKNSMGGWTFPAGLNLSEFQYLVVETNKLASSLSPAIRLYDVNNVQTSSYCSIPIAGSAETVIPLAGLTTQEGAPIDLSHIYIVGLTIANSSTTMTIKDLHLANDDPTAIGNLPADVEQGEPTTWYDVTGRKVVNPSRAGIYVKQGRVVAK